MPLTDPLNPLERNQFAKSYLTTVGEKSLSNYSRAFYDLTMVCPDNNLAKLNDLVFEFSGVDFLNRARGGYSKEISK